MGTTLTGTTPQDTYDSLIKVTDNGPISATAKYLSDGLGNDSVLALSTSRVGIGTATPNQPLTIGATNGYPVIDFENSNTGYGDVGYQVDKMVLSAYTTTPLTFWTNSNERLRIDSAGNVGIGTSTPDQKLNIVGSQTTAYATSSGSEVLPLGGVNMTMQNTGSGGFTAMRFVSLNGSNAIGYLGFTNTTSSIGGAFVFGQRSGDGYAEQVRIQAAGGISFNGDTAAANALDDYEEGTWTIGVSFGGASVGVTTSNNTGTYTKIGRQVTVNAALFLTSKGSSTGDAKITGLPFTIPNSQSNYSSPSLYFAAITFTNQFQGYGVPNSTTIDLREITILGVETGLTNADFANNSTIIISFTYFV